MIEIEIKKLLDKNHIEARLRKLFLQLAVEIDDLYSNQNILKEAIERLKEKK